MHALHFRLADIQICQATNLHVCTQCNCAIFTSENTLAQHHGTKHHDSQITTNLDLCIKHIQGELPPNQNLMWDKGLQFIHDNIAPDPASFWSGVCEKVLPKLQEQFDDVVMGIIYTYLQAAEEFVVHRNPCLELEGSCISMVTIPCRNVGHGTKTGNNKMSKKEPSMIVSLDV